MQAGTHADSTNQAEAQHGRVWPPLPYAAWKETRDTLHMWTQIVGKLRLALSPPENHWWQVPLYVNARGLTTSLIPHGTGTFECAFDFVAHELIVNTSEGLHDAMPLRSRPVARFYQYLMTMLDELGIHVRVWPVPVEVPDPIAFPDDSRHAAYDPVYAQRFWQVLASTDRVMKRFRSGFQGKTSPVHLFWGSFDLAMARFSGRRAPVHPSIPSVPDRITHEAYSHEVSSCGFWPGDERWSEPSFYAYAYPEPIGYARARVAPVGAVYQPALGEFVLPYDVVRTARDPDEALLAFFETTYEAAAELGSWDRDALERRPPAPGDSPPRTDS